MNAELRTLLKKLDEEKREDAAFKYEERISICVESGLSEWEAEAVALSDLRKFVAKAQGECDGLRNH